MRPLYSSARAAVKAWVLDGRAALHHHPQTSRPRAGPRLVDHPEHQSIVTGADGDGPVDVDALVGGNGAPARISRLTQKSSWRWGDGDDPVAAELEQGDDAVLSRRGSAEQPTTAHVSAEQSSLRTSS
jgi:hypothetical protein